MKKIQIALVSKETLPVYYMINEFRPDEVYLVGTNNTKEEMKNINNVASEIGVKCYEKITEPNDIKDTYKVCSKIHNENGIDCEYRYNLTCGTKLMAFGALICAQEHKSQIVYTEPTSYTDFEQMERKDMTSFLDIDTIIALQGQKVKDKVVYAPDPARTECANKVKEFIESHTRAYGVLRKCYERYNQILEDQVIMKGIDYGRENGCITIRENGRKIFSSDYKDAYSMLFEGRWWEALVADAVREWAGENAEIWTSVRFEPKAGSNKDKNEVDVLVNVGNVLMFVECKSGPFDQNNIYKLDSVCKTYGSYKSLGVIIEYRQIAIKPELVEKAKEARIKLLVPQWNRKTGELNVQGFIAEMNNVVKRPKS